MRTPHHAATRRRIRIATQRTIEALERRTLLSAVIRTATTDDHARQWFRRYWTFGAGSGAHVLLNGLFDVIREMAENRQRRALWDEEACAGSHSGPGLR